MILEQFREPNPELVECAIVEVLEIAQRAYRFLFQSG